MKQKIEDFIYEHLAMVFAATVLLVCLALIASSLIIAYVISSYSCSQLGEQLNKETQYNLFGTGCAIRIEGELIPTSVWMNDTGN